MPRPRPKLFVREPERFTAGADCGNHGWIERGGIAGPDSLDGDVDSRLRATVSPSLPSSREKVDRLAVRMPEIDTEDGSPGIVLMVSWFHPDPTDGLP
ncbi:MAG: hypothetical protein R2855_02765 [Thermomicrobiales bacterium]